MRRLKLGLSLFAILALLALVHRYLPTQHNPFRAADLTAPIGLATYGQLTGLKHDEALCRRALAAAGVAFSVQAADPEATSCPLGETLVLQRTLTPYNAAPLRMTCHQMAALHVWERQVVRPKAERLFGSPLRQIETYGTFSCRNIAGTKSRSEHAFANAIDISGFVLEDGRRIAVKAFWRSHSPEGRFLKAVHKGGCRLFSVTLGPDYNAAHADHFHFDMGRTETCR